MDRARRTRRPTDDGNAQRESTLTLLDGLVRGAPVGLAILDRERRFVRVNEALARLNGVSIDQHVGRSLPEVLPQLAPLILPELERVLATGCAHLDVPMSSGPNASAHHVLASFYPLRDEAGNLAGLGVAVEEVTGFRRAEQLQREREAAALLRAEVASSLAHHPGDLRAALTGACQAIVRHTNAVSALLFLGDEQGTQHPCAYAGPPRDAPFVPIPFGTPEVGRIAADGKPRRRDGIPPELPPSEYAWAVRQGLTSFAGLPLAAGERVLGVVAVLARRPLEDSALGLLGVVATLLAEGVQRYRAEDELRRSREIADFLAEASKLLGTSLDYADTLTRVVQMAVPRIADWCAIDVIGASGWIEHLASASQLDPAQAEEVRRLRARTPLDPAAPIGPARVIRTGEPELVPEITPERVLAALGDTELGRAVVKLGLTSSIAVPLTVQGRPFAALSLGSARSARRYGPADLQLAEELARRASLAIEHARAYAEVQEAVRVRDAFLSIASHELKTPLTTLGFQVSGLKRDLERVNAQVRADQTAQKDKRIRMLEAQTARLGHLVNQLLDVSRITAGRLELNLEDVDLGELVCEAVGRFEEEAQRTGSPIRVRTAGRLRGRWDRLRLEGVLTNLLSNALKYGRGQPIEIEALGRDGDVLLAVRDHGIGIPEEHQQRIFERFERAVSERSYGGFGLGLWIVRQIVDALGGTVTVESRLGEGACFVVTLPRSARARA